MVKNHQRVIRCLVYLKYKSRISCMILYNYGHGLNRKMPRKQQDFSDSINNPIKLY